MAGNPVPARASLRERWLNWRNRTVASPGFQRWAVTFPPTRFIARRQASRLFDLVAGFVYSQVLAATVKTDLLARLSQGPRTIAELAPGLGLPPAGAERLIKAAAALELVERLPDGCYGLGMLGAGLLGNPGVAAMIAHHDILYADLADPVALLRQPRGGRLAEFWDYAGTGEGADPYSALMAASQPLVAREILDSYPFARHRVMIDVGGGDGAFLAAVAERFPKLDLTLFDLPGVIDRARQKRAELPRLSFAAGDVRSDPLPPGADLVTLVRVLHDHDDADALAILRNIRSGLKPGGVLLVAEPMSDAPGARRMGDAYFGLYLAAMGQGRPRKSSEIRQMLMSEGFARTRTRAARMPLLTQSVEGWV